MRISWRWIQELITISESVESFAERLTRAGLEVESIFPYRRLPEALKDIIVGEVVDIAPHPAADRLFLLKVQIEAGQTRSIITGAQNLAIGDKVPVALPGARVLKDGQWKPIEARAFRGILSEGMVCSEAELGLGSDADGILRLPSEVPIGIPLISVLEDYEDIILEISVTPNRGDALSHLGIAREYAALTGTALILPEWKVQGERIDFPFTIEVPHPESCPRYGGIYVTDIEPNVPTPSWIRYRLEALGMRSIHPVVDVTNYILLGYGQPLHAFDADKLRGNRLRVFPLESSEEMKGLGGQSLFLRQGDIVIADEEGAACLGGILGGERTSISSQTRRVFIESAYFSPAWIRRTSRRLGLNTESSYRFARGTDPDKVPWAAEAAATLLQKIYPQAQVSHYVESHVTSYTAPRKFLISLPKLRQLTGLPLPAERTRQVLERLDIKITPSSEEVWQVEVPRYRLDVERPADIAEELLRIEGWDSLPPKPQPASPYPHFSAEDIRFELKHALSEVLTGMGLYEIRTNSLVGKNHLIENSGLSPIRLANPLYEELAYLRTSLIGSGLEVLLHNRNHGAVSFWAFEWGRVYGAEKEEERLGLWGWGRPPHMLLGHKSVPLEYLLAVIRTFLKRLGAPCREEPLTPSTLWREGVAFYSGDKLLGVAGHISESFLKPFQLKGELVAAAELNTTMLDRAHRRLPMFSGISYHPVVVKDLSLYVPAGVTYATLIGALESLQHPYLRRIEPFDRYQDKEGRLSYGLRLYLQSDHTLSEEEIHEFLREAIAALEKTGAQVRKGESI
ncbi:MAG: phenylalanine--tRNA ligase subunit beta [Bacteroidia bacterium]|nr:phenylalanine--tRNA ligase subunit beta [Bacteroidia bacterium]